MRADLLIVGQGLAGTVLAWELERAGVSFVIADAGHAPAATRVAAGIINPITGRRIVKSWRVDTLLPLARETYRAFGRELGVPLWQEMRVRRLYVEEDERRVFAEKQARGELADYAGASDGEGFWIEGAARVDLAAMIAAARARWLAAGRLREQRVDLATVKNEYELVIDCTGAAVGGPPGEGGGGGAFGFVPWQFSKGEGLDVAIGGLAPDVVLNRGHWVLPTGPGRAKVGATHQPGRRDRRLTTEARAALEASLTAMTARAFTVTEQEAGVRVYLGDKKPVIGRHPAETRLGVMNGLGSKGALFAPGLARQWLNHLTEGVPFERDVDLARLGKTPATGVSSP